MANIFKKAADAERKRINEAMAKVEPGTEEYSKLLRQRNALEEIEAKRQDGRIKPIDVFKFGGTVVTTAFVVTADCWLPNVASKLRLGEMIGRLVK